MIGQLQVIVSYKLYSRGDFLLILVNDKCRFERGLLTSTKFPRMFWFPLGSRRAQREAAWHFCFKAGGAALLSHSLSNTHRVVSTVAQRYKGDQSRPITVIVVSARPDWPLCSGPVGGRYFKLLLTEMHFISESDSTGVEAGQWGSFLERQVWDKCIVASFSCCLCLWSRFSHSFL